MAQHFPIICWTFSYLIVMWFHWSSMSCLWDYIHFVITLSFAVQLSERQSSFSLYGNGLHLADVGWCWCHVAAWFIKSMGSWSISTSIQPLCMEVTGVHSASECRIVFSAYCMIKKTLIYYPGNASIFGHPFEISTKGTKMMMITPIGTVCWL